MIADTVETLKMHLRIKSLAKLKAIDVETRLEKSYLLQIQLQNFLNMQVRSAESWAGYIALPTEPAIAFKDLSPHIVWSFPKVLNSQEMTFVAGSKEFSKSNIGVYEPQDGKKIELAQLRGVVIPALAYDKKGFRLGRGMAFYDRCLVGYKGLKIGVCYEEVLENEIPVMAHDIRCDFVITEKSILNIS